MKRTLVLGVAAGAALALVGWQSASSVAVKAQAGGVEQVFANLHYRLIGPYNGARTLAISGSPGNSKVFYFGSVDGGVWKTTNAGEAWTPMFDKEPVQSVGALEVAPSDPDVIYVGTGEGELRNDISYGDGVYKSTDAGKTWMNVGLHDSQHISRIMIDPQNPDRVFVAAMGHASGPNSQRGIFRTLDGGQTWQKVLYKDDKTGGVDVAFDPTNPQTVYASLYQFIRLPWRADSGGPGSGLYKSTDGGTTWTQLTGNGLPGGVWGKSSVSVGANGQRVYALIEAKDGGLYVSDDAGATWKLVNNDDNYRQRAWYFTHVFADPKDVDTVYVEDTGLFRSTDGGKTFRSIHGGDSHGFWIDPTDNTHMMTSSDEGAFISLDDGRTWSSNLNQPTGQFYSIATDNDVDYHVYGEKQDAGSVVIATRTNHGSIGPQDQYSAAGGESGWLMPKPDDSNIVYGESYDGDMSRYDVKTGFTTPIGPWPDNPMGHGAIDMKYRFQWSAPIATDPWNPNVVYYGGNVLFKSNNEGDSWQIISPDLTKNDKSKELSSGGPITQDNTSAEYYDVIFAIAESPVPKGQDLIWVGSDDGLVHVTRNGGKSWSDVTPPELREPSKQWAKIGNIDPSPFEACTAYVAARRNKMDDFAPYAYRTTDCGKTWTKIVNGIPNGYYVQAVAPDTKRPGLLFAGTELGVFVSYDNGDQWQPLQLNLPHVSVRDLEVHGNDLVLATHGRAFWSLDDITPLRQYSPSVASAPVTLFKPEPAMRTVGGRGFGGFGRGGTVAQNPPGPAVIDYELAQAPDGPVTIDITNAQGELLKHFSSANNPRPGAQMGGRGRGGAGRGGFGAAVAVPNKAGFNRFVWNLQALTPPQQIRGEALWAAGGGVAPIVPPGVYTVKLTVDGQSYTTPITVTLDPRLRATTADLQAQWDLAVKINNELTQAWSSVRDMVSLQTQIAQVDRSAPDAVSSAGSTLSGHLDSVIYKIANLHNKSGEDPLNYPIMLDNKLAALAGRVEQCTCAPTSGVMGVYNSLTSQLDAQLTAWHQLQSTELVAYNALLQQNNLKPVAPMARPRAIAGRSRN